MYHLSIFLNIAALMAGTLCAAYTFFMLRSRRHTFLKPFLGFVVFSNLVIAIDLTTRYSCVNLVRPGLCESMSLTKIAGPLSSYFFILMTVALARMALLVSGWKVGRRESFQLAVVLALVTLTYVARIVLRFTGPNLIIFPIIQISLLGTAFVVCVAVFAMMAFRRIGSDEGKRALMAPFGRFYLLAFMILFAAYALPGLSLGLVSSALFIAMNVFPCFWYAKYFEGYLRIVAAQPAGEGDYGAVLARYNITRREMEIAGLIISGKSNKEIESSLFISMNTVKNHIYNLYRKTGVNSRSQLISMIHEELSLERSAATS